MRPLKPLLLSRPKIHSRPLSALSSNQQWLSILSNYYKTKASSLPPLPTTIPPLFKACAALQSTTLGAAAHADAVKYALTSQTSTANSIANFYLKCGMVTSALQVFDETPSRDSVSWNSLIHGLLTQCHQEAALGLFADAVAFGFAPNVATLVLLIQACWRLGSVGEGRVIHGFILKGGQDSFLEIQNSLLSFYAKSSDFVAADEMFDQMTDRDVISWSVMVSCYAQSGRVVAALRLFREMCGEGGVGVDGLAVVGVLQACGGAGDVGQGRSIHGHLIRRGFGDDLFVGNSLIDMYSKCLDVDSASKAFSEMSETNIVSWNSLLSGLVLNGRHVEAIKVFDSMRGAGIEGDEVALVNLLQVCKRLGHSTWCKCIHSVVIQRVFGLNLSLLNSLLDAYAKCDLMGLAVKTFERMKDRNVVSWSTMIAGFAHCGQPDEAVTFFGQMMLVEEKANAVAMLSLLEACAVSAELKLSKCAHGITVRNSLATNMAVGTALLHMYGKCGDVSASRKVFSAMPERNVLTWNAMIGALGINGCANEALCLLKDMELENVKPNGITMLTLLSACSHGGLVQEGLSCFRKMMDYPMLQPAMEHYSCVVDMLGRAGYLESASEAIEGMPKGMEAGPAAWGALLSACRGEGDREIGERATSHVLDLEPLSAAGYLLSSRLYAQGGLQDHTARVRMLMKERGVKVASGYSLVHIDQRSHRFTAWDPSHPESKEIYFMVELLHSWIKWDEMNACSTT